VGSLERKQILVIGGSSGIGLATARLAAARGAIVTIASRSETRLREALGTWVFGEQRNRKLA
jgi:NAD(P)-dependent dehydrogenase (short-subunit alcohol dehydrogenase family)